MFSELVIDFSEFVSLFNFFWIFIQQIRACSRCKDSLPTEKNVRVCDFCFCGYGQANFGERESSFCVRCTCTGKALQRKVKTCWEVDKCIYLDVSKLFILFLFIFVTTYIFIMLIRVLFWFLTCLILGQEVFWKRSASNVLWFSFWCQIRAPVKWELLKLTSNSFSVVHCYCGLLHYMKKLFLFCSAQSLWYVKDAKEATYGRTRTCNWTWENASLWDAVGS